MSRVLPDVAPVQEALQALVLQAIPWQQGGLDPAIGLGCYGLVFHAFSLAGILLPPTTEEGSGLFVIIQPPYQPFDVVLGCHGPTTAMARHLGIMMDATWGYHMASTTNGVARFTLTQPLWHRIFQHGLRYKDFMCA